MAPHHAPSARRTPRRRTPPGRAQRGGAPHGRTPRPYRPALAALAVAAALLTGCTGQSGDQPSGASGTSGDGKAGTSDSAPAHDPDAGSRDATGPAKSSDSPGRSASATASGRPTDGAAPGSGGVSAAGATWCAPGALKASLRPLEAGAGNRYAALVLVNTSDSPCRSRGWPGLQLTRDDGSRIPTETTREHTVPSRQFTLKPGDQAWTRLHWTVVPGTGDPGDGTCPSPGTVRVIPPDQRRALSADWKLGTVCGAGEVRATALRTGSGPAH